MSFCIILTHRDVATCHKHLPYRVFFIGPGLLLLVFFLFLFEEFTVSFLNFHVGRFFCALSEWTTVGKKKTIEKLCTKGEAIRLLKKKLYIYTKNKKRR